MLNGISPILIFRFSMLPKNPLFDAINGIPLIGEALTQNIGIPIPIYLDQNLSGIVVNSEEKGISITTTPQQGKDGSTVKADQRGISSHVTINMTGVQSSVILTTLLALCDVIFKLAVSKGYTISYMNGPTVIFNGLLEDFSTSVNSNEDKIEISMKISKVREEGTIVKSAFPTLSAVAGVTPAG